MSASAPLSDIAIARAATLQPIARIAERLDLPEAAVIPYGRAKAKIDPAALPAADGAGTGRQAGRLILVSAITPTPAGEGKTTTTVGLGDALNRIGRRTAICLREPSLGPCFGQKGGAAGGGYAQVVPMEDINLHFTGDFHAIGAAHNLLAAMIDNHIYWGNALGIDQRRVTWRRVVDMNDRALRQIVGSLGGAANGFPREDGFDITVASEVMAILCLARDLEDLERRLGAIVIGQRRDRSLVRAADLKADGAMAVLLKDAMMPNLVQTLEGSPALVHGGPFANIAHGCNSVVATRLALGRADYVVTEAGFGADLGAQKFLDIKCRKAGIWPSAVVVVATIRALKMHGGVARADLGREDVAAVEAGFANLHRHVENLQGYGLPVVVAVNAFSADTATETAEVLTLCRGIGVKAMLAEHWARGGAGAEDLARVVVEAVEADGGPGERPGEDPGPRFLYPDAMPLIEKVRTTAQRIYRAADIAVDDRIRERFVELEAGGFGHLPVCIAKTQYSFSADPARKGAPEGHTLPVREVRLAAGAEFVVVVCGDIMTMPGLPRVPAAEAITLDAEGRIQGLF